MNKDLEKLKKLTKKQKAFADEYIETGHKTNSALKAYDTEDYSTAATIGSENMKKHEIQVYLDEHVEMAKLNIVKLANNAENENVRLNANKDIIDRNKGKSPQGIDITTDGDKLETGIVVLPAITIQDEDSKTAGSEDSMDAS